VQLGKLKSKKDQIIHCLKKVFHDFYASQSYSISNFCSDVMYVNSGVSLRNA
jgi:hypothetical protein